SSELSMLLDLLIMGGETELEQLRATAKLDQREERLARLSALSEKLERSAPAPGYVAVGGGYSDIQIQLLLGGLRPRSLLSNLARSDTFTASPTLERHLAGLDFSRRVLDVEIIHGVDQLVSFLGCTPSGKGDAAVSTAAFSKYESYLRDKQEVLSFETDRVGQYEQMTERRADKVYRA